MSSGETHHYEIRPAGILPLILALLLVPVQITELEPEPVAEVTEVQEVETHKTDTEVIVELIRETFPEDPDRAVAIATCESNLNPLAKGPTQDGGLFQIHVPSHGKRLEELGLDIWNPEDNVRFARILYDEQGWDPWVCHTKGLAHL